jgi:hypothetical protein
VSGRNPGVEVGRGVGAGAGTSPREEGPAHNSWTPGVLGPQGSWSLEPHSQSGSDSGVNFRLRGPEVKD